MATKRTDRSKIFLTSIVLILATSVSVPSPAGRVDVDGHLVTSAVRHPFRSVTIFFSNPSEDGNKLFNDEKAVRRQVGPPSELSADGEQFARDSSFQRPP